MDQFLLRAVASEAARLVEQEVQRVSHLGRQRYLLRFASPARDSLLLSVRPELPRFHLLTARRVAEEPPDRFASLLEDEIGGAILEGIDSAPWDRVVSLRFRASRLAGGPVDRTLVVALLGRSANLHLLDGAGSLLGSCREPRAGSRSPSPRASYTPPSERERFAGLAVDPAAVDLICARFGGPADFLSSVSPAMARALRDPEIADRPAAVLQLREILAAVRDGRWSPVVDSSRPLSEFKVGDDLGRDDLIVSALPLPRQSAAAEAGPRFTTGFASPSAAAEEGFGLVERLRDFRDLREHHQTLSRKEIERIRRLVEKLQIELDEAHACGRHRRMGEALLAGLGAARVAGRTAMVPDPYDPTAASLEIPVDPALPLQENARLLFERYKKGKRAVAAIGARLQAARSKLSAWEALGERAARVTDEAGLDRLRDEMSGLGLVHGKHPSKGRSQSMAKRPPARVRRYESPDGYSILVGKSGEENDTLTFRVASPDDFWLHAAGYPGAHVVVRNPRHERSLPDRTLRAAAEIAAFHSGARGETKVEVHYTQRKHVHRRKGAPRGQVLLRRFRSIQAAPRLPSSTVEEV
jgi:predicted ribosome quality control (RQC) complex YloA/Tae2 family protein